MKATKILLIADVGKLTNDQVNAYQELVAAIALMAGDINLVGGAFREAGTLYAMFSTRTHSQEQIMDLLPNEVSFVLFNCTYMTPETMPISVNLPQKSAKMLGMFIAEQIDSSDTDTTAHTNVTYASTESICKLSIDELLDLMKERGGFSHLTPAEKARLDELAKK